MNNLKLKQAYENALKGLMDLQTALADVKPKTVAGLRQRDIRQQELDNPVKTLRFGLLTVEKIK